MGKNKMKYTPCIFVNIRYNESERKGAFDINYTHEHMLSGFDYTLHCVAKECNGKFSDAACGAKWRDIGFVFYTLQDARQFYVAVKRFKGTTITYECTLGEP
jgi:hypothetical protein